VIGAELHLDVKTVLWQETTAWQEGSDTVAGNGDVPPAPVSRARRSTFPAGFRVRRSQGSLPDWNLGCSTHQAMRPLVQPGLHTQPPWPACSSAPSPQSENYIHCIQKSVPEILISMKRSCFVRMVLTSCSKVYNFSFYLKSYIRISCI